MTVYYDQRTGLWRYDFWWRRRRVSKRGFKSEARARRGEYDRRLELERGLTDPFPTFGELVAAWIEAGERTKRPDTVKNAELVLDKAFAHLALLRPREVTRGHIEPVLNRLAKTRKASTVNNYRSTIGAVCNYGVRMGAMTVNPVAHIELMPRGRSERRPIPTAALRTLIAHAQPDLRALLIFCSQTGCRWIEAARLTWDDVRLGDTPPVAILVTRKRRGGHVAERRQPLTATAMAAIESMRGNDSEFVFPGTDGKAAQYQTDRWRLQALCRRLKLPAYSFHPIRHWAGTVAAQAGRNRRAIADLLGHHDTGSTDIYTHAVTAELVAMATGLERALALPGGVTGGVTRPRLRGSRRARGGV